MGVDSAVQPHSMSGVGGERMDKHRNTHTGTYTQMLHLPFSDLPLKKFPIGYFQFTHVNAKASDGSGLPHGHFQRFFRGTDVLTKSAPKFSRKF